MCAKLLEQAKMKTFILPKTGIQETEKYAVDRISNEFPREWRAYASLELVEKGRLGREIDLVIITHDRVLIVELKRWNGQIKSENGYWYLKRPRKDDYDRIDTSPVKKNNDKAKILKGILERTIKDGHNVFVDSRVVLCGNSPSPILAADEKPFVLQLEEFLGVCDKSTYQRLLPLAGAWARPDWKFPSPLERIQEFDLLFQASSHIKARDFSWQNYKVDGAEIFRHPSSVYREYRALNRDDPNAKALLRRWDFKTLGTAACTREDWVNIAQREARVYSFVKSKTDELEGTLLRPLAVIAADEVTSDHCELFELPLKQKRLFEFVETYRNKLSVSDRLALTKVLISKVSELHKLGVAHRDIGDHCVWLERPQSLRLSGLVAAYFPQMETLSSLQEQLSAVQTKLPEDFFGDKTATPFHRDVFMLGCVVHLILFGTSPETDDGLPKWKMPEGEDELQPLEEWFGRALNWETNKRWANASEMLDALNDITFQAIEPTVPLSAFDYFQSRTRVKDYEELDEPIERGGAELVRAELDGVECQLKVWYGVKPDSEKPQRNQALLRFLEKAKAIQVSPSELLPRVLDVGLNNRGLLYAREWLDLPTLRAWLADEHSVEERLMLSAALVDGITRLHAAGISHGDIHPANVLVRIPEGEAEKPAVVFIDTPDFKGSDDSVITTAYAPANYQRLSVEERDRYAVVMVLSEIVRATGESVESGDLPVPAVYEALAQCVRSQPAILTLAKVAEAIEQALAPPAPEVQEAIFVTFANLPPGIQAGPMISDNGGYYIEAQGRGAGRDDRFHVVGPGLQIRLWVDRETKQLRKLDVEKLTHASFQRRAFKGTHFPGQIVLSQGAVNDAEELIGALYTESAPWRPSSDFEQDSSAEVDDGADESDDAAPKQRTAVTTRVIWQNLIEAEAEALPELEVTGPSRPHPQRAGILLVPYRCNSPIEYAPDEEVDVFQDIGADEPRKVATLEHRLSNGSEVALANQRLSLRLSIGSRLTLQGRRDRSSYIRRQDAVERILARRSVIPNLYTYFERSATSSDVVRFSEPKDEELEVYDIFEDDARIFSLNDDQKAALKKLCANGPVSLLQGPPGTGKTAFIAAFIHYVVSKQAAQSVLLVSQSHEATNNALERVLDLSERTRIPLEVVRLGEDGVLSEPIRHVGVSAVQESFRERFRSEIKTRIVSLSSRLALNKDFVDDYVETMTPLLRLYQEVSAFASELEATKDEEDKSAVSDRLRSRTEAFISLASRAANINDSAELGVILAVVETDLTARYNVKNPAAVERLGQLVRVSIEWVQVLGSGSGNFAEFLAKTRTVVAGTCVGVGRWNLGVSKNAYDWVIVDEAARATPSELAVAMQVGRRILLVGDHFQLPPFFRDELRAEMSRRLRVARESDVFDSDFERAFESEYGDLVGAALLTQYRMAPAIGTLVSECFYKPRGKVLKQGRPGPKDYYDLLPEELKAQVLWVDTSGVGRDGYESDWENNRKKERNNPFEARLIVDVLRRILTSERFVDELIADVKPGDAPIGVVAMYASQVKEIERELARADWLGALRSLVKVDTVDSYQGKENRVVLLSLVRNNPKGREGFLRSPNRLNVAMSRAMDRLIIVGASSMWREKNEESPLATVLKHIEGVQEQGMVERLDARRFKEAV